MQRVFSISLLLVFLADTVGSTLFMHLRRATVRKEMKEWISKITDRKALTQHQLTTEEFSQIQWIKQHKEFVHEGYMHDVESIQYQPNGDVLMYTVQDHKESKLDHQIRESIGSPQHENSRQQHFLLTLFKFLSHLILQSVLMNGTLAQLADQPEVAYLNSYLPVVQSHLFQPPDSLSDRV